ncbi:MAG: hypothetical protein U0746_08235 [Gemmataceae bacterium]
MNFSEQRPSNQWTALTFRGERIADVWFKPEGEPLALVFRIPQSSFQIPDLGQRLTAGHLLKAVSLATDEVESWHHGGDTRTDPGGPSTDLTNPLPQPPHDVTYLEVHVRLKPPPQAAVHEISHEPEAASADWHDLEVRWKTVLGLEATVDTLRMSMESLRAELEASQRRMLSGDEKVYALAADVAQWTKAKSRAHYAVPKASEFIHRATWAAGTPERKRLGEVFKDAGATPPNLLRVDEVLHELEMLRKDRQVLSAKGTTVYQECKAIVADIQSALRRLQSNAATRASQKKGGTGAKGRSF